MAKLAPKTPRGQEQHHAIKYTLVCQQGQAWLTGALVALTNSVALRRGCFTKKKTCFKRINCSAEAIHRYSWSTRYCMNKLNWTNTHTTTVTLQRMRTEG